jgi:multidrug efflux system outer membrane protein
MKLHHLPAALAALTVLFAGGCVSVGPDYEPPEPAMPDAWHTAVQEDFESGEPDLRTWWTLFDDETLNALIERATTNSLTLKTAAARIEQAAALRGVSASQYWPDITAGAAASAVQNTAANTPPGSDRQTSLYQADLTMAWELDLWGRVRRSVESADASLQATVENYRDILVVLYADIAVNYINVRTLQERIRLAEGNLEAQAGTLELTRNRFDSGLVPALDVAQSELNFSRTQSLIPPLRQQLVEAVNRLSVLVGEMPYALERELAQSQPIPSADADLVVGVPAELLRQRPDLRRAERDLAAQHALIGATQAELYPTLTLPGTLAVESFDSNLFSGDNALYSFGPQLRWNIFNGRRIRSRIDAEEAASRALLHTYEQTLLLALEEVEDSMSAYAHEKDRVQSLEVAADSAQKSVDLVTELYKSGLTDFQNVLISEEALLTQQDELASSQGRISRNLVGIYKALGGGWNTAAEGGNE